jgi:hypothetical protein
MTDESKWSLEATGNVRLKDGHQPPPAGLLKQKTDGSYVLAIDFDMMPAGRQMDAAVAHRVMGWDVWTKDGEYFDREHASEQHERIMRGEVPESLHNVPPYSTDDAAALEVLKALPAAVIHWYRQNSPEAVSVVTGPYNAEIVAHGPTLALAICRAALKAAVR